MAIDRNAALSDPGVFGVISALKLKPEWRALSGRDRAKACEELKAVVDEHADRTVLDIYLARGLKASCDYFVRVHAYDLAEAQRLLSALRATTLGAASDVTETLIGVTQPLKYITPENSREINRSLTAESYHGPDPRYAIVIPVKKSAEWWNMSPERRLREIETHTTRALPFLTKVTRKLYHSTGLDDIDFITYFETADLLAFHDLMVSLASIPENTFHVRWGSPTILGTLGGLDQILDMLAAG